MREQSIILYVMLSKTRCCKLVNAIYLLLLYSVIFPCTTGLIYVTTRVAQHRHIWTILSMKANEYYRNIRNTKNPKYEELNANCTTLVALSGSTDCSYSKQK